jgi:hypothetical protein
MSVHSKQQYGWVSRFCRRSTRVVLVAIRSTCTGGTSGSLLLEYYRYYIVVMR